MLRSRLRIYPLIRSHHLHRYIRKEDAHGLSIVRRALVIGGKEQWTGLLIPLPGAGITFGRAGSGPREDEFLQSVVFANIERPGVARRVATLRRIFHHH